MTRVLRKFQVVMTFYLVLMCGGSVPLLWAATTGKPTTFMLLLMLLALITAYVDNGIDWLAVRMGWREY